MDMRRNERPWRKCRMPGKRTLAQRFRNISLPQNIPDNAFDAGIGLGDACGQCLHCVPPILFMMPLPRLRPYSALFFNHDSRPLPAVKASQARYFRIKVIPAWRRTRHGGIVGRSKGWRQTMKISKLFVTVAATALFGGVAQAQAQEKLKIGVIA